MGEEIELLRFIAEEMRYFKLRGICVNSTSWPTIDLGEMGSFICPNSHELVIRQDENKVSLYRRKR